ncbi:hypothetical protein [Aeromonas sp. MrichA-1]|uniref:hypothetical protein n=1 Tax=Aeromonas sp. MrichA-1 TaxID=2823362 RepID=UPI001B33B32A|nr:hypothetical protein [Aeromonas sp. MrichA-1]MBP4081436.1 hypothetical protein [Aeromonas sp. MrichA-1]
MEQGGNFEFLTPEFQDKFWGSLDPDVRLFFDRFETKENWTYKYSEIPHLFQSMSEALPTITNSDNISSSKDVLHSLIVLLSSLPLRECIYAIGWLDKNIRGEYEIGWGVALYMEAESIYQEEPESDIHLHAKVIRDRVRVTIQSTLSSELFCNINAMGDFI